MWGAEYMSASAKIQSLYQIRQTLTPILKHSNAKKAIVFGSYARGEADEYSDLDLIIVADTARSFFDRYRTSRASTGSGARGWTC